MRHDGRRPNELRALDIEPDYLEQPHGSVLYKQGKTIVLCTATVEEEVPRWLRRSGRGWMTAEYAMLPASTGERTQRAVSRGRPDGRTVEIQRLIGRALRSVCDFEALGERTLWLDCDVLQADGGTRCASITGAWIAARRALDRFGLSKALPGTIAAVSVGIVGGEADYRSTFRCNERERSTVRLDLPHAHVDVRHSRVLPGHDEVAAEHEALAEPGGVAVHARDNRLLHLHQCLVGPDDPVEDLP